MIRRLISLAFLLVLIAWLATHSIPEDWHWLVVAGLWVQRIGGELARSVLGKS